MQKFVALTIMLKPSQRSKQTNSRLAKPTIKQNGVSKNIIKNLLSHLVHRSKFIYQALINNRLLKTYGKLSLGIKLFIIFIITSLLIFMVFYFISPYWYSRVLLKTLRQNDLLHVEQQIPIALLTPLQADKFATRNISIQPQITGANQSKPASNLVSKPTWQGAGAIYLQQVWPTIAEQQNMHQLLLLQFNSAPDSSVQSGYSNFPSRFRMTLGSTARDTIWFEWQRQSWLSWQLREVCFYNPQPVVEQKSCLSSKR